MIIDPVATAGLVAREVRTGSRDGVPTKIAVATRTYPTDQADLWDAVTNPDRIPRWFLPVSGELVENTTLPTKLVGGDPVGPYPAGSPSYMSFRSLDRKSTRLNSSH